MRPRRSRGRRRRPGGARPSSALTRPDAAAPWRARCWRALRSTACPSVAASSASSVSSPVIGSTLAFASSLRSFRCAEIDRGVCPDLVGLDHLGRGGLGQQRLVQLADHVRAAPNRQGSSRSGSTGGPTTGRSTAGLPPRLLRVVVTSIRPRFPCVSGDLDHDFVIQPASVEARRPVSLRPQGFSPQLFRGEVVRLRPWRPWGT